jgi:hypothetical protein
MNVSTILQQFEFPKDCLIDRVVPKKTIYEHAAPKQKKMIQSQLNRLRWMYALKTENTNISSFRDESGYFPEVEYFIVEIDHQQSLKELATNLMQLIPYPMVLFFTWAERFCLVAAQYRTNQSDSSKIVVQRLIQSKDYYPEESSMDLNSFIQKQSFASKSLVNFKTYYESVISTILKEKLEHTYSIQLPLSMDLVELDEQLEKLETNINERQSRMKKADQFNRRVALQIDIHNLEEQKIDLLKRYKTQE